MPNNPAPDFDKEVLIPIREQREKKAREAAEAALNAQTYQTPYQTPFTPPAALGGDHTAWMTAAGIAPADFGCADAIIVRESGWRWWVVNAEGATGIPQALPGSKMASAGADWATNPVTQLIWMKGYVNGYGGFCGAWAFWQSHNWY